MHILFIFCDILLVQIFVFVAFHSIYVLQATNSHCLKNFSQNRDQKLFPQKLKKRDLCGTIEEVEEKRPKKLNKMQAENNIKSMYSSKESEIQLIFNHICEYMSETFGLEEKEVSGILGRLVMYKKLNNESGVVADEDGDPVSNDKVATLFLAEYLLEHSNTGLKRWHDALVQSRFPSDGDESSDECSADECDGGDNECSDIEFIDGSSSEECDQSSKGTNRKEEEERPAEFYELANISWIEEDCSTTLCVDASDYILKIQHGHRSIKKKYILISFKSRKIIWFVDNKIACIWQIKSFREILERVRGFCESSFAEHLCATTTGLCTEPVGTLFQVSLLHDSHVKYVVEQTRYRFIDDEEGAAGVENTEYQSNFTITQVLKKEEDASFIPSRGSPAPSRGPHTQPLKGSPTPSRGSIAPLTKSRSFDSLEEFEEKFIRVLQKYAKLLELIDLDQLVRCTYLARQEILNVIREQIETFDCEALQGTEEEQRKHSLFQFTCAFLQSERARDQSELLHKGCHVTLQSDIPRISLQFTFYEGYSLFIHYAYIHFDSKGIRVDCGGKVAKTWQFDRLRRFLRAMCQTIQLIDWIAKESSCDRFVPSKHAEHAVYHGYPEQKVEFIDSQERKCTIVVRDADRFTVVLHSHGCVNEGPALEFDECARSRLHRFEFHSFSSLHKCSPWSTNSIMERMSLLKKMRVHRADEQTNRHSEDWGIEQTTCHSHDQGIEQTTHHSEVRGSEQCGFENEITINTIKTLQEAIAFSLLEGTPRRPRPLSFFRARSELTMDAWFESRETMMEKEKWDIDTLSDAMQCITYDSSAKEHKWPMLAMACKHILLKAFDEDQKCIVWIPRPQDLFQLKELFKDVDECSKNADGATKEQEGGSLESKCKRWVENVFAPYLKSYFDVHLVEDFPQIDLLDYALPHARRESSTNLHPNSDQELEPEWEQEREQEFERESNDAPHQFLFKLPNGCSKIRKMFQILLGNAYIGFDVTLCQFLRSKRCIQPDPKHWYMWLDQLCRLNVKFSVTENTITREKDDAGRDFWDCLRDCFKVYGARAVKLDPRVAEIAAREIEFLERGYQVVQLNNQVAWVYHVL